MEAHVVKVAMPRFLRQQPADTPTALGTVKAINPDGSLSVLVDGSNPDNLTTVAKACDCSIDSRVVVLKSHTEWVAIAVIGGSDKACPYAVGDIYMTENPADPSIRWSGTTWAAYAQGRVPVGVGSNGTTSYTQGATGGADSVTLTTAQMPSHGHQLAPWTIVMNTGGANKAGGSPTSTGSHVAQGQRDNPSQQTNAAAVTGGGASHENRMPYIAVYIWKRTA